MPNSVHGFHNLPALFGGEIGEDDMGYTRKDTGPVLDKIIQFIHLYQREHDGATPSQQVISNEIGKPSVPWFINILVDDDRLERISGSKGVPARPFRVRILEHPKNRAAIKRLDRALEAAKAVEAGQHHERSDKGIALPPSKPTVADEKKPLDELLPEPQQFTSVAAQIEPTEVPEISLAPAPVFTEPRHTIVPPRHMNWNEAEHIIAQHGGNLEDIARAYILGTARPGDLLEQLLDRGYTVAKTNPKWRD